MQVEVELEIDGDEGWKQFCANKLCRDKNLRQQAQAKPMTWPMIFKLCGAS